MALSLIDDGMTTGYGTTLSQSFTCQAGDILVASYGHDIFRIDSITSGWTVASGAENDIVYKIADGTETSFTVTWLGDGWCSLAVWVVRDNLGTPTYDASQFVFATGASGSFTLSFAAQTPSRAPAAHIVAAKVNSDAAPLTWGVPTGFTLVSDLVQAHAVGSYYGYASHALFAYDNATGVAVDPDLTTALVGDRDAAYGRHLVFVHSITDHWGWSETDEGWMVLGL